MKLAFETIGPISRPQRVALYVFIKSAAVILGVTGAAKVWTSFSHTKIIAAGDPIIGISFGHLLLIAGIFELLVAAICMFGRARVISLALVSWLATCFLVYRIGLWWIDWHKPCGCMGNLSDALHLTPQTADNIMKVILAYLLLGGHGALFWLWRQHKKASVTASA